MGIQLQLGVLLVIFCQHDRFRLQAQGGLTVRHCSARLEHPQGS